MSLKIRDLGITIAGSTVVRDIDLDVPDAGRIGLVGASGSGKSMICKAILGLLPLDTQVRTSGSITMDGIEILGASDRMLSNFRGSAIGTVFQNPASSLNPMMKAFDQIVLPLKLHYDLRREERRERVMAMLDKVGLDERHAQAYPCELSGGQQQRVAIAAALVTSPRLIIADEPTTALDSLTQRQIIDLLMSLVDQTGSSMLFITHDFSVLRRASQYCYVIDRGAIVEAGRTEVVLEHPSARPTRMLVQAADDLTLHSGITKGDVQ
ncbi:ABC transporter ATP-binding protein [Bifidobacterium bombi]|uniref:Peptide ABC transporter, ATP-binding protein n=1 Tax=Bifidobacterium bombi DSM 19703 TaxID=1341695 RepID=A0A080N2A2_9BIFI|nr:ABC transporter ATP-binding protein [Bifidobacterium bombi]KFF31083.1 peptide ABC transporter, ATP-binding protein [Bifidobacterium bombi DSM 19703]